MGGGGTLPPFRSKKSYSKLAPSNPKSQFLNPKQIPNVQMIKLKRLYRATFFIPPYRI
jgi:hypothetical protein